MRWVPAGTLALSLLAPLALPALGPEPPPQGIVHPLVGSPVGVSAAALLVSGMMGGRLDVSSWAVALPSAAPSRRVVTAVDLGLRVLEDLPGPWSLEIVTYVFTPDEAVAATSSLALELDGAEATRGILIIDTLSLQPGNYVLRTLIRERESGELAVVATELEVPRRGADRTSAVLWMLRPAAGWVLGIAAEAGWDPRAALPGGATTLIPAALVELEPGRVARALLLLPRHSSAETAIAAIRDPLGDDVATVAASLEPPARGSPLPETRVVSFAVPALEPGPHTLSFLVDGGEIGELAFLAPATSETRVESVRGLSDDEAASLRGSTRSVRAAIAFYAEALALQAVGDPAAAAALQGLEQGVRRSRRSHGLQWLMKAEQNVITRLAAQAPSGLTPVLALHAGLLAGYSAAGDLALESHTMQVLLRLASEIERRAEPADYPRGAAALARAGADLLEAGWALQADRLFELALELDGTNRGALLGTAALREKTEQYAAAVELLESLVEAHPDDEAGRLRLALNLARVKRVPRAMEILRALAPAAETEWISVVAFHELARLEATSDLDAAVETLEAGLGRWPGEQGLALLRTLLRDRRAPGARTPVPGELLRGSSDGPAPRYLYNRWPRPGAEAGLDEAGRRELARWLEGLAL